MANLEIVCFKSNDFRVLFKIHDEIVYTSISCVSKIACFRIMNALRRNSKIFEAYTIKNLTCGSWCFILKNLNSNEPLGRSKTYISKIIVEEKLKIALEQMSTATFKSERKILAF